MSYDEQESRFLLKIGQRIRILRETHNMTQEQLSFKCGLHRTYISSVERGERNIALINLQKIASALQVSLAHFFTDLPDEESETNEQQVENPPQRINLHYLRQQSLREGCKR